MDIFKLVLLGGAASAALTLARPSVAEVPAPAPAASAAPQAQTVPSTPDQRTDLQLRAAEALAKAKAAAEAGAEVARSHGLDQRAAPAHKFLLAQQDVPAPPAAAALLAPSAPPAPPTIMIGQVPYNPVTDDPASPGYIPPGQPGAGHPVPADLAKLLNARKDGANAPWTLTWLPKGAVTMTPEQRADLDRKMAAIGLAINKAIADAHIDETVQKALSAQDAKTRDEVAKQLQQIGPLIQQAIANAHIQELVGQRLAQLQPLSKEHQAQAEEQIAAQLEEQAKMARERAQKDREQLKDQPAPAPAPNN